MSCLRPVPVDALRTQAWANGAGTTTEIASNPVPDWTWRLSIAAITQACDFSVLPETRRQFVPLDAPVTLCFSDRREHALLRLQVIAFDGSDAPHVTLPDGPTRAFNLMLRGHAQGELIARPLNGSMWLPVRDGWRWFVHVISGTAQVKAGHDALDVSSGANLWVDAQPGEQVRIEGGGELVMVQLLSPVT